MFGVGLSSCAICSRIVGRNGVCRFCSRKAQRQLARAKRKMHCVEETPHHGQQRQLINSPSTGPNARCLNRMEKSIPDCVVVEDASDESSEENSKGDSDDEFLDMDSIGNSRGTSWMKVGEFISPDHKAMHSNDVEWTPLTCPETCSVTDRTCENNETHEMGSEADSVGDTILPLFYQDSRFSNTDNDLNDWNDFESDDMDEDMNETETLRKRQHFPCNGNSSCNGDAVHGGQCCYNCKRQALPSIEGDCAILGVNLRSIAINDINFHERKWKTFDKGSVAGLVSLDLCEECNTILSKVERSKRKLAKKPLSPWAAVWPVYMWKMMVHPEMLVRYGSDSLHWIPSTCHRFWKASLCKEKPLSFDMERFRLYSESAPIVKDVTVPKREFANILQRNLLGELKQGCDKYLMPRTLCPWGCTAYLHDCGSASYDAVISQFFPFLDFSGYVATPLQKARVNSVRSDFLSTTIDMHLHNPEWTVHPSIAFDSLTGPVVLTCDTHKGGSSSKYFHLPKTGGCLPSSYSDVLSHAVITAKTLHRTKAFHYSTMYQLNKCTGTYSGVECSHASENRKFDFVSHLTDLNEARSYAGRMDIRGLVGRLEEQRVIPTALASSYAERAADLFGDQQSLDNLSNGATMITLCDSMKLQGMLSSHPIMNVTIDCDAFGIPFGKNNGKEKERTVRRQWPSHLIRIHPSDDYGAKINAIPAMTSSRDLDYRLLWTLCHALLCVPSLWEQCTMSVSKTSQWHGYVLAYLSRNVLGQSLKDGQFKGDPFDVEKTDERNKPQGLAAMLNRFCVAQEPILSSSQQKFNPSDLAILFKEEINRGALASLGMDQLKTDIDLRNAFEGLDENCENVMIHCDPADGLNNTRMLPDVLDVSNGTYELRFLSSTTTTAKAKSPGYSWKGSLWTRHGAGIFNKWWTATRSPSKEPCKQSDLSAFCWKDMNAAVYVRKRTVSLEKYRREYLQYIGGQSKVGCSSHDVPLIITPGKRSGLCRLCCQVKTDGARCREKEEHQCPCPGCDTRICCSCFKALPNNDMTMISLPEHTTHEEDIDDTQSTQSSTSMNDEMKDTSTVDDNTDCDEIEARSVDGTVMSSEGEDHSDHCFDYTNLHTGANGPGCGTGEFAPEITQEHQEELLHDPLIPTTIEDAEEIEMEGGIGIIGTSVLLNKCGTMLVRRDNQLQSSRRERNAVEKVVARKDLGTVPLVHLEGILFPSIFWSLSHSVDGGILGSMPTSLFCQNKTRKRFGIATMADHAKTRLKSIGSTASTDPRYLTFLFDSIANGAIEGQDTRVVLSRGFEESMGPAGMRIRNKDDDLYSDTIDNRQCVHDLCASERDDPADLFVTLTCNQREHFGIRKIKRCIDDGDALINYKKYMKKTFPNEPKLSDKSQMEVQRSFQEASRTLTVRNWMEIRLMLLRCTRKSPEKPLGDVTKLFVRDEYQGDAGNLSHVHMLVTLRHKHNAPEGKKVIEGLVKGFVDEIVGVDEVEDLIAEGLIDDWDDYETMKTQAKGFLAHHHSERCMRRTGPNKGDLVCGVPDARIVSKDITQFSETLLNVEHSSNAVQIMERLGLCKPLGDTGGEFVPTKEYLQSKRIHAPVRHGEGNITPVVGRLFAATRSTMNVQICTSNGTTRYVVKCVVKIDENNYVTFKVSQQDDQPTVEANKVFLHNTKITSSAINEAKKLRGSRDKTKQKGRSIACTEMMQLILGFPQVHCSMEFVRVPTLPLGERPGVERMTPQEWFNANLDSDKDAFSIMVPSVLARAEMFKGSNHYRCHTPSQILMLQDQMMSKVTLDRVFLFGIRPPELLFIDKMEWYFQLFERAQGRIYNKTNSLSDILSVHLSSSPLIDGLGHQLRLRARGIPILKRILESDTDRNADVYPSHRKVIALLQKIIKCYGTAGVTTDQSGSQGVCSALSRNAGREWHLLQRTFITYYQAQLPLPIVVFSNVKPHNASKFVIHLLLSMGRFGTERDIWMHASIKDAFVKAGLVVPDNTGRVLMSQVDSLLNYWIEDQLRYYPVGSKKMDECIVAADDILQSVLIYDEIPINELPPVMCTSLVQETDELVLENLKQCKESLVDATLKALSSAYSHPETLLPTKISLMEATKHNTVDWNPNLPRTAKQSQSSYEEQCVVQQRTANHIDRYMHPATFTSKNLLIAGPPGVGKTHCLSHGIVYALSRGLVAMTTAMLADRAFMLGGRHLHKLFKLRVRDRGSPHRLAELAIISLQKKPELFAFLRRLDILFIDECGQISAELLSVLDIILRKVRDSSLFMGGVLLVGTIDQVQLRPITGLPFLLSPCVLTTFSIIVLKECVRCADCMVLQEMNELARAFPETREDWTGVRNRLRKLICNHCSFVSDWGNALITDDVLRIFPRREETGKAIKRFLSKKKATMIKNNQLYVSVEAQDTMVAMESHSEWKKASNQVSSYMTTKIKEPPSLDFYKGAVYQFTHNCAGKFNATQLAFLLDMPSSEQLAKFEDIEVFVAPAGTKAVKPSELDSEVTLLNQGWLKTKVGVAPPRSINMWNHGAKAKRKQYGLRHHVASTTHSAIGHTVPKIATELGPDNGMWEKAMVVVLISRVSKATDLIFVGDKQQNINAIMKGLSVRNQCDDCMNHAVNTLSQNELGHNRIPAAINQCNHPFRQQDLPIPSDRSGVVYLIVSINEPSSFYIGMTQDMGKRIKQHNSGIGAQESSDSSKRPWGLFAYVSGFAFDRSKMRQFELRWQNSIQHVRPSNPHNAAGLAQRILSRNYDVEDGLLLVAAGETT